jgi:hypothetical protein
MKIEPYDAYRIFMAIKLHFESDSYNAIKYRYKTSVTPQSFWKRKDKYHFAKVAKKYSTEQDLIDFFVCQFSQDVKWVGDMIDREEEFTQWKKKNESLSYFFDLDVSLLAEEFDSFDSMFEIGNESPYPKLINHYLQDRIDINTVSVINKLTGFLNKIKVSESQLYPEIRKKILNYECFMTFDQNKMVKTVMKHFEK